jgi:hypothetical protein
LRPAVPKKDRAADWKPPEFDEVKFMRSEIRTAHATIAIVLWTLPAALLSYGLTVAGVPVIAFFAGIGMMFLLKWILPLLRIETSEYKRKDWIGHGFTFFFSWLAFWILLLNPPFADLTSPTIVRVSVDGVNLGCEGTAATGSQNVLTVFAADNVGVTRVTVNGSDIQRAGNAWTTSASPGPKVIVAYDAAGHSSPPCSVTITP